MHSKVTEKITPEKQLTPLDSAIAGNSEPVWIYQAATTSSYAWRGLMQHLLHARCRGSWHVSLLLILKMLSESHEFTCARNPTLEAQRPHSHSFCFQTGAFELRSRCNQSKAGGIQCTVAFCKSSSRAPANGMPRFKITCLHTRQSSWTASSRLQTMSFLP